MTANTRRNRAATWFTNEDKPIVGSADKGYPCERMCGVELEKDVGG